MEILVTRMRGRTVAEGPMEIVERKGVGHPDSLCDIAAEELSLALCRHYLDRFGRILHHNVDKVALVGGRSRSLFGDGRVTAPIRLIFIGRAADHLGRERVPVKDIAVETGRKVFSEILPHLDVDKDLTIDCRIRPGSADLVANYDRDGLPASNDTSLGVGFAPFTETENVVLKVEGFLNGKKMSKKHLEWGQDIKVMGTRVGKSLNLTVALAFVSRHVPDLDFYLESREQARKEILRFAAKHTSLDLSVDVNRADVVEDGLVYLTVTGTSAESGDDGQVGRGNRPNGIITPYRPMTLEAAAGKNPTTHVGKIYNLAAWSIAQRLARREGIDDVHVYLVSAIGSPVNEPRALEIRARSSLGKKDLRAAGRKVAKKALKEMPLLWQKLLAGKHRVC
ncbi:MAG: methionine adenosyltransferase [Planctomycetota bacterium]